MITHKQFLEEREAQQQRRERHQRIADILNEQGIEVAVDPSGELFTSGAAKFPSAEEVRIVQRYAPFYRDICSKSPAEELSFPVSTTYIVDFVHPLDPAAYKPKLRKSKERLSVACRYPGWEQDERCIAVVAKRGIRDHEHGRTSSIWETSHPNSPLALFAFYRMQGVNDGLLYEMVRNVEEIQRKHPIRYGTFS
ncbi:hypothetical protein J4464_06420 [Candidatus Woesearchaeota archaeon]|nr:hypothetical protein [Candidatus Woesearchaeota archaeon]